MATYPTGLALDLALNSAPISEVLDAYSLTPDQLRTILKTPVFRQEYEQFKEEMKVEGWSFRQKAKAQAEQYLHTVWNLVGNERTPAAVKADLIKNTVRRAGLDTPSSSQGDSALGAITGEMLRSLQDMPDSELEVRVFQVLAKRTSAPQELVGQLYDMDGNPEDVSK